VVASERDRTARCHQHRSVRAGWRCDGCQKYLCPDCTASALTQFYCCLCEQRATQLGVPRSERPFLQSIADALLYPFRKGLLGLILLAALSTGVHFAITVVLDPPASAAATSSDRPLSPVVFPPVRALLIFVYAALVVVSTARGGKTESKAFMLSFKALAGTLILWLPAAAYLVFIIRGLPSPAVFGGPMPWLFTGLAAVYLPMAMSAAASEAGFLEMLNPFRLFVWAVQAGRHFWLTVASVGVLVPLAYVLAGAGVQVTQRWRVSFLGGLVAEVIAFVAFAAMARLVGRIVWLHGDAFDWGPESHFRDPLITEPARGTRKRPEPIAGAGQASGAEGGAVREKPEPMLAREVIQALGQRSTLRALKLYESRASWSEKLFTERHLLDLGLAALNAAKLELAEKILSLVVAGKSPVAGRAMLGLARTYQQTGRDPESIRALWQQIVERYPGTDMARAAASSLEGKSGPATERKSPDAPR
jgi:hypothetical protein